MSSNEYIALIAAFKSTAGYAVHSHVQSLSVSFGVFSGNEQELTRKLREHADPSSLRFDGIGNRQELEGEFREIIRLLHNYVASAMSLVDHTRRIARKVLEDEYLDSYQKQVDSSFKNDPLTGFIKDLRNYLLHVSHPPVSRVIRYEPTHIKYVGIEFAAADLRKWDGWQKQGLEFLKCNEVGIELTNVVTEHGHKVRLFLRWLQQHIGVACKAELDELWAKHDKWVEFCKKHGIQTTDEEFRQDAYEPKPDDLKGDGATV